MSEKSISDKSPRPNSTEFHAGPTRGTVLVSGASFAGLATAYWLHRLGYEVTVIEVASALRRGGTPVDIEGETIGVLARMGVIDAVRAKALSPRAFEFKDAEDNVLGSFGDNRTLDHAFDEHAKSEPRADVTASDEKYEIHRDDLLDILHGLIDGVVQVSFNQSIASLVERPDHVKVTFADGSERDYALVFGCDGNRSNTRRLAFHGAGDFSYFMGGYFLIKVVPTTSLLPADVSQIFSVAERTALLNGYDNQTDIAFAFRTEREIEYDYRDRVYQRRIVREHFDGLGWKVPAMLDPLEVDNDFYFDKINQIRMPTWSIGRIALVGYAGYCVSPVAGMGGSMAIIGAARLGDALEKHGDDYNAAFREYHDGLCAFVNEVQERAVNFGMATMFSSDDAEMAERNRKLAEGVLEL